jgi:transcriptional regulator with XRE-family HTH domain
MVAHVGDRVRELMDGLSLSQAELARKAHLPAATVSRIVSGQRGNPRLETLRRIADALSVPVDYLCNTGRHSDEILDPEIELFFSGEWHWLPEDEKDWVRRIIRMVSERRKARGMSGGKS